MPTLAVEDGKLSSLRGKFKQRNQKAGNAKAGIVVDAHGRQKTELSKQRVKRDELKRAVDLSTEAVALLRKATAAEEEEEEEHTLDCVDFEDLLDTLKAVCIELTASAAHYLVGYLLSKDNRTKVPVIRLLYGSSLKFTSSVNGEEVGSCDVMDRIIDTAISLVPSSTEGRVQVTDVVTDGEYRARRLKPSIAAAEKSVEDAFADLIGVTHLEAQTQGSLAGHGELVHIVAGDAGGLQARPPSAREGLLDGI